jgi:hypothetical protein
VRETASGGWPSRSPDHGSFGEGPAILRVRRGLHCLGMVALLSRLL